MGRMGPAVIGTLGAQRLLILHTKLLAGQVMDLTFGHLVLVSQHLLQLLVSVSRHELALLLLLR